MLGFTSFGKAVNQIILKAISKHKKYLETQEGFWDKQHRFVKERSHLTNLILLCEEVFDTVDEEGSRGCLKYVLKY